MTLLVLPYPPSTNALWRYFNGRAILSAEARAFKAKVALLAKLRRLRPLEGPVAVEVRVYRPKRTGDLDGRLKATLDACNGVLWVDDSQVVAIAAFRFEDKANPRVEVSASEAP